MASLLHYVTLAPQDNLIGRVRNLLEAEVALEHNGFATRLRSRFLT